jgi:hypothetical protein
MVNAGFILWIGKLEVRHLGADGGCDTPPQLRHFSVECVPIVSAGAHRR